MNHHLDWRLYAALAATTVVSVWWNRSRRTERFGEQGRHAVFLLFNLSLGLLFYPAAWLPWLLLTGVAGWAAARLLHTRAERRAANGVWLWPAVAFVTIILLVVKNHAWLEATLTTVGLNANVGGWRGFARAGLVAHLGISYVVLRLLSLLFDAARGRLTTPPSLLGVLNFLLFFPTLVAGPLDRYERFCGDVRRPAPLNAAALDRVLHRGMWGLFQKVVLADTLARWAFPVGAAAWGRLSTGAAWTALYAYAGQIYFDFAGYSLLAICAGRLWGVRVPENFDKPYLSRNITEFWRRWHISFSEWLRDYVFMPLGMTLMRGPLRGRSLAAGFYAAATTFLLCGLWHGTAAHYAVWGLYHGLWVFLHKAYLDVGVRKLPPKWWEWSRKRFFGRTTAVLATFHGVAFSWILFAAPDLSAAGHMFLKLFLLNP